MRDVCIVGIGQTAVGERWDKSLRDLSVEATLAALSDARVKRVDCIVVGNMLSGVLASQENLGTLVADFAGLSPVEAVKVEAACASGGAALREAYLRVASGGADLVVALAAEKMTDFFADQVATGLALASDGDYESLHGVTFVALNALIMRRYMYEFGYRHDDFAPFCLNAHRNAASNPYAMFRREVTAKEYAAASMIASPINLLDSSPVCDGAAAAVLCPASMAREFAAKPVRIAASAAATDTIAVATRKDPIWLAAAAASAERAYRQSGKGREDIDLFELHDAFSIMAALELEACGFAERGQGVKLALEGEIGPRGRIPVATLGGLKARGHPVGATGMFQVADAVRQLRGEAGASQVPGARVAMTQNIGGSGSNVVTHILQVEG